jgi:hypothetical protein
MAPLLYAAGASDLKREAVAAAVAESFRILDVQSVVTAFHDADVHPLFMKGTALAYQIYVSPELRPRGDTDVLVRKSDLPVIRRVMTELGFRESPTSGDEHGLQQTFFVRKDSRGFDHSWDVHWAATNAPMFAPALDPGSLFESAVPVPTLHPQACALSPVAALLLACIHRIAHHHDSDRLIWLVDIALLRDRLDQNDEREFWMMAAAGRVLGVCERSCRLADEWMSRQDRGGPERWLPPEELEKAEASRLFLDRDITRGGVMLANLRALSWGARLQRLWQLAFPPADYMRHAFRARSSMALPFLYLYRAFRGVVRLFRRAS